MKNSFVVLMVLGAASALAMPTKEELTKAQSLVVELMADDVAAYKAKSKKAEEIGNTSVKYAKEASTEAAKFLLLKGAISYYVRGESYDKAADAVNALREAIPDVPPDVLEEIIRKNTARVTAKKAPRLYAMYRTVQVQMEAAKEVRVAKAALAKKSKDEAAIRKLAEAQALSGDWKSALVTFAQLGNKAGTAAKSEMGGKSRAVVADFWWDYKSYLGEDDADVFKMHAAAIYRKCLDDGSIDGLKKNLVGKRLKQVEIAAGASTVNEAIESEVKPKESQQDKSLAVKSKNGVDSDIIDLLVVGADPIRLIKCPAGAFKMGFEDGASPFVRHKVKISRPFWMSEAPITVGQYCAFMGVFEDRFKPRHDVQPADGLRRVSEAMGGASAAISGVTLEEIAAFCGKLSAAFAQKVPQGCVFRLPTDAEWAYAFSCGGKNKDRNYAALAKGEKSPSFAEIAVDGFEVAQKYLKQENVRFRSNDAWMISAAAPRYRVKTCRPNTWGFYDMAGLCWERLADTIPPLKNGTHSWSEEGKSLFVNQYVQHANSQEVDPVMVYDGNGGLSFSVSCNGGANPWAKWVNEPGRHWDVGFRLVVGPDLVSEWKEKRAKK